MMCHVSSQHVTESIMLSRVIVWVMEKILISRIFDKLNHTLPYGDTQLYHKNSVAIRASPGNQTTSPLEMEREVILHFIYLFVCLHFFI